MTSLFLMSESSPCRHDAIINLHHLLVFMSQQSIIVSNVKNTHYLLTFPQRSHLKPDSNGSHLSEFI